MVLENVPGVRYDDAMVDEEEGAELELAEDVAVADEMMEWAFACKCADFVGWVAVVSVAKAWTGVFVTEVSASTSIAFELVA